MGVLTCLHSWEWYEVQAKPNIAAAALVSLALMWSPVPCLLQEHTGFWIT